MFCQENLLINSSHHLQGLEVTTYIYPDLLQDKLRRWCMSEWCCTAIDYPWFPKNGFFAEYLNLGHESAKNEFVKCLNQVEMGHGPKLIRVEWGVITRSVIIQFICLH
jgi:hypothetical protein